MAELIEASTQTGAAGGGIAVPERHPVLRHHAIARRGARGPELLCVTLRTGEEVLPLFSSESAAKEFLASQDLDETWYARECYAGELVSFLLGLYAGVDGVLLDTVYESRMEGYVPENFVHWSSFVSYLLEGQGVSVG